MSVWTFDALRPPDHQRKVEEIYTKYKRLMFATAGKFADNPEDQEDIVQTVLERLVKLFSASDKSERCISAGYIVYMVRSVSIDFLRKQGQELAHYIYIEDDRLAEMVKTEGTLDDLILPSESAERLRAIWPKLSIEDRILLEGKYILSQTDKELAIILNCRADSIRMKLTRARRRAGKLLSERGNNE